MMRVFPVIGLLLLGLIAAPQEPEITPLTMPDQHSAGETFLTRSADGHVLASWIERMEDGARMVWSKLDGNAWSAPVEIARGDNWFVNWADVPSLSVHENGVMMAHWLERLGDERYAYGVRYALSSDGGYAWSEPEWLHADRSATEHGFARIVPHGDGFLAVWLDGNAYATERREMAVHARTIGFDGTLGSERAVDTRTCDCCPTELVTLPDGRVVTFYRDRSDGEQRDLALSVFDGQDWSDPSPLNEDGWVINACPVNGPAADVAGDAVAAAWFTMATNSPEVWMRFMDAGSLAMTTEPVRIDVGRPAGRVAVRMVSDSKAVLLWMEGGDPEVSGLYLRTVDADGTLGAAHRLADTSTGRSVGYPRLERDGDDLIATWTEPGAERDDPARLRGVRIAGF